jgi:hypothetical protein
MTTLSSAQRRARSAAVLAESERTGCDTLTAIRRVAPAFRSRAGASPANETTRTQPLATPGVRTGKTAGKAQRKQARAESRRLVKQAVAEALTAAQGPKPPPGAAPAPVRPAPAPRAATRPLHQLNGDELAALTTSALAGAAESPFWRRESSPAAHSDASAQVPNLSALSADELHAYSRDTFADYARGRGFASPVWAG